LNRSFELKGRLEIAVENNVMDFAEHFVTPDFKILHLGG
jgi:hypothetical protein